MIGGRNSRYGMSKEHLKNIRKLPSCLSGRMPCEAHHLRIARERGVGLKSTDRWAVPLTRDEHNAVHQVGSKMEEKWFKDRGVNAYALAEALWAKRGDLEAMRRVIE